MTPCEIEVMLWCCGHLDPHPKFLYPAILAAINKFEKLGLITRSERFNVFSATEKGKAWVAMICATPLPVLEWLDPRTRKTP